MNNHLKVFILSFLILLILVTIYMIMDIPESKSTQKDVSIPVQAIRIAPLKIEPATSVEKEYVPILPIDILSKLKMATEQSKEAIVPPKRVEAKVIKKVLIKPKPIKKKLVIKKKIIPKKEIIKKEIIKKEIIVKKETKAKVTTEEAPLAFVKKLGVVSTSANYESAFIVPEKEEFATEGIVNISTASLETQEMKNLEFVNTLGVIEVSQDFETLDADKYLN